MIHFLFFLSLLLRHLFVYYCDFKFNIQYIYYIQYMHKKISGQSLNVKKICSFNTNFHKTINVPL